MTSYEEQFHAMEWLQWQPNGKGGIQTAPIISGGVGSSHWLKSKLLRLGVDASIEACEGAIAASRVVLSRSDIAQLQQSATPGESGLLNTLKLGGLCGNAPRLR